MKKCTRCHHELIKKKDCYECPYCLQTYSLDELEDYDSLEYNDKEFSYENELINLLKENSEMSKVNEMVNNILTLNKDNNLGNIINSFIHLDDNVELFKNNIINMLNNVEKNKNFDIIIKFIIDNIDQQYYDFLEDQLIKNKIAEDLITKLTEKKNLVLNDNDSSNYDVFINYAQADLEIVEEIVNEIEKKGLSCWFASRDKLSYSLYSSNSTKQVVNAIKKSKVFVTVISKDAKFSTDVQNYMDIANKNNKELRIAYHKYKIIETHILKEFNKNAIHVNAIKDPKYSELIFAINKLINDDKKNEIESNQEEVSNNNFQTVIDEDQMEEFDKEFDGNNVDGNDLNCEIITNNNQYDDTQDIKSDEPNFLNEAINLYEEGLYDEAMKVFKLCENQEEAKYYIGRIYLNENYKNKDYNKAYDYIINLNDIRLKDVIHDLGNIFFKNKQYEKSLECFKKGSQLMNVKSMHNVAILYSHGLGTEKNINEEGKYYKMAADYGDVESMYRFGNICFNSISSYYDESNAIKYITDAANKGHAKSQYSLALCYLKGIAVHNDYNMGLFWLDRAIENGSIEAKNYKNSHFNDDDDDDDDENNIYGSALERDI